MLMSFTIEGLRNKFFEWLVFVSKSLKVDLMETKVMFSRDITKDGLSSS